MIGGSFEVAFASPPQKWFFMVFSEKAHFLKKLQYKKITEISLPAKKVIFVFIARCALPFEGDLAPLGSSFSPFSLENMFFSQNCRQTATKKR